MLDEKPLDKLNLKKSAIQITHRLLKNHT
jgi:hypothetical protein